MPLDLDEYDHKFLRVLHENTRATIAQLCEIIGVTPTAIRQRLARLSEQQLVARVTVRTSRGRPHHLYELTRQGRSALGDNYSELAIVLWQQIQALEDRQVRDALMESVRKEFIARLGGKTAGETVDERLEKLAVAMERRGSEMQVLAPEPTTRVLREKNCPYQDLAIADKSICEFEQGVFEHLLGVSLEVVHRCTDGHGCCEFVIQTPEQVACSRSPQDGN